MTCPHCKTRIFNYAQPVTTRNLKSAEGSTVSAEIILTQVCPECDRLVVEYFLKHYVGHEPDLREIIWPKLRSAARPVPPEVPEKFAEDYLEACLVLEDSPKASAALSRRCLQLILRDELGVSQGTLFSEIKEVINRPDIPSHISGTLDQIRKIGNFAAHPNKYKTTGEIVPVEQGEAEWCLELIEELFDFCFVAPARARQRQQAINAKLRR